MAPANTRLGVRMNFPETKSGRARSRSTSEAPGQSSVLVYWDAMGTPWDAAAPAYLEQWMPRFLPYHLDLVGELTLRPGERVFVPSAGPGSEVLAAARLVGPTGFVQATDGSEAMVRICREQVERARLPARIVCRQAEAADASGGPWDAVICAFGLWQLRSPIEALSSWSRELTPHAPHAAYARVGVMTWGPGEASSPFQLLGAALHDVAPAAHEAPAPHVDWDRESMRAMFAQAGLALVRHTVVRHTLGFHSAEAFVRAMRDGCTWRRLWLELGDAAFERVAARFYELTGGPEKPLSFDPAATVAVGYPR
jgi:hypothetical protein